MQTITILHFHTTSSHTTPNPIHVTITKGQIASFDESTCELYKNHVIEVIGLLDEHIDHGRALKALSVRELTSPFQLVGHHMECTLQFKRWAESGSNQESNKENVFGGIQSNNKPGGINVNDEVENMIKKMGENETWGCKRVDLHKSLEHIEKTKVDMAVQYLVDEGMIYNTLDDDTFKSSDQ